jgi:uncharacterized membrane protein YtjA (UPF0391 family)
VTSLCVIVQLNCRWRRAMAGELHLFIAREDVMLHWSLVFLIIAIIAGLLGFTGIAGAAVGIAKILFFIFLVVWLVALLMFRKAV